MGIYLVQFWHCFALHPYSGSVFFFLSFFFFFVGGTFQYIIVMSQYNFLLRLARVGILARMRVIDPLFFLWTHKF